MALLSDIQKKYIKQLFNDEFGISLTDSEVIEVGQSMYYFGRAVSRFYSTHRKRSRSNGTLEGRVKGDA